MSNKTEVKPDEEPSATPGAATSVQHIAPEDHYASGGKDEEQKEAAALDGAPALSFFVYIVLPHIARAITVVVLIETIFLLSVFAEIFVTTNGGPGNATTNIPFLVYKQALLDFDVGGASAGGIIAVILANIVAIFLMRIVGKNLES